jgi:lysophospholipase L1-like esterase
LDDEMNSAVIPVKQTDSCWEARHEAVNKRLKKGNVDLLFIGDSITRRWEDVGKKYWDKYYEPRNAVNMGFGGDLTQHVLWRLEHSDFGNISPKLAVVLIGTNNSNGNDYTAEEIAEGITAVCRTLRSKLPKTKILLLGIFPRDRNPSTQRQKNAKASLLASRIADNEIIYYLDISAAFLTKDGVLSEEIASDYLHLEEEGYRIWADSIEPKILELIGE